jgi:hypothetical protein
MSLSVSRADTQTSPVAVIPTTGSLDTPSEIPEASPVPSDGSNPTHAIARKSLSRCGSLVRLHPPSRLSFIRSLMQSMAGAWAGPSCTGTTSWPVRARSELLRLVPCRSFSLLPLLFSSLLLFATPGPASHSFLWLHCWILHWVFYPNLFSSASIDISKS